MRGRAERGPLNLGGICPTCGSWHIPATRGDGVRVWCGGVPVDPRQAIRAANQAVQRAKHRAEHLERMRSGQPRIEPADIGTIPDSI